MPPPSSSLRGILSYNWHTLRTSPVAELSGALGDLGTLLPLMIALTVTRSISLSSTLVVTGLANIVTGLAFGVPLPVQPMKAIAAVAIANNFSKQETAGAGLFVGGVIGFLSVTGLLSWVGRVVPIPVVKGIQVGAGLTLVLSAGSTLLRPLGWTSPHAGDNLLWALAAFVFLLATTAPAAVSARGLPRVPFALIVFLAGLAAALVALYADQHASAPPFFGAWRPRALVPTPRAFRVGALDAGLGQIPLTVLNSIVAVTHLSAELLPSRPAPAPTALGLSVAAANLLGPWLGAMPVCHGAGGLAAQHRFGARSGAGVALLGLLKLALGAAVREAWLVRVLGAFPRALLGVMVLAAGVELARVGEGLNVGGGARDLWEEAEGARAGRETGARARSGACGGCGGGSAFALFERGDVEEEGVARGAKTPREPDERERAARWTVMMVTVAGMLAFGNDAVGFAAGLLCHWSMRLPRSLPGPWARRRDESGERTALLGS